MKTAFIATKATENAAAGERALPKGKRNPKPITGTAAGVRMLPKPAC